MLFIVEEIKFLLIFFFIFWISFDFRSPCFLSLFNGCFEEEAESLTGEEINARDGNSSSVSGDDADLFAASTDVLCFLNCI